MMSTLHQRLRTACQPAHTALERSPLLSCLTNSHLTVEAFATILQRFYACHLSLYDFLHAQLQDEAFAVYIPPACRLEALRNDLAHLGYPVPTATIQVNLPTTMEAAMGVLYVLLGANLGSLMIAQLLAKHSDERIRQAKHFYGNQAQQGLHYWQTYMQSLEACALTTDAQAQVISAANATFTLIATAFRQPEEVS